MAYIILGLLIGIIIGFVCCFTDGEGFWLSTLAGFGTGLIGAFIGVLVWIFAGGFVGYALPTKDVVVQEQKICALSDSATIEGRSFLFSGYIEGEFVCRYVIETDKGKHIEEVDADKAYINEGNYDPAVKIHREEFKNDWYYWFALKFEVNEYVEFFVPDNTVTSEYNIDLQ